MGIATNWLMGQLAPLVQRVQALEAKPFLTDADRQTLTEARALLDEMGAAPRSGIRRAGVKW